MPLTTEEFFSRLYSRADPSHRVTLWTLPDKQSYHLRPDPAALAEEAMRLDALGLDVYFGVALRVAGLGPHQRGGKRDVAAVPGLWLDIDIADPTHAASNLPVDLHQAAALLDGLVDPSCVVHSGGGLHVYWLFVGAPEPPDRTLAQLVLDLQEHARRRAAINQLHLDSTANLDRVLRVPGTTNRKDPTRPRPVAVLIP